MLFEATVAKNNLIDTLASHPTVTFIDGLLYTECMQYTDYLYHQFCKIMLPYMHTCIDTSTSARDSMVVYLSSISRQVSSTSFTHANLIWDTLPWEGTLQLTELIIDLHHYRSYI